MLLLGISGCLRTAPIVLPDDPQTIAIPIVDNRTLEYGAEERVTDVLVQEFIRDGRLQVVPREEADMVLDATLEQYHLRPLTFDENEQAVSYNLSTRLTVTLRDQRPGAVFTQREIFEEQGVFFLSNQPGLRREEQVYRRIAEAVISRFLEGW